MFKFKFVISAIPIGHGGAGDYLDFIIKTHKDYVLIAPLAPTLNKNGIIYRLLYGAQVLAIKLMTEILVKLKVLDSVVLHHPQSLGYNLVTRIIKSVNTIDYWVLDTSFFCKQSYNYHNDEVCFRCIRSFIPYSDCQHFPLSFPLPSTDECYLELLQAINVCLEKITFHVQTVGYEELLKYRFGESIKVTHKKMIVPEFFHVMHEKTHFYDYEFGFHANLINAKGFLYTLELSNKLINTRFFMPDNKPKNISSSTNVFYMPCSWSSGLGEKLARCKVILCPSIWTAPVEAAVIKSMLIGRPVGLISSQYNLSCEIPPDCFVSLIGDAEKDSIILQSLLDDKHILDKIGENGRNWATGYINDKG